MVEPMIELLPCDRDAKPAHVGEIGKAEPAWWMLLSEDDILLGTVHGPPGSDAALKRPPHARADLGTATAHLLEDGDGPDARRRHQHRHDLAVPYASQRIWAAATTLRLLLRR